MDDKKIRKLSKKDLLEILLAQAKKIEELETELEITKQELESKRIAISEAGSLAEAALKLNGIFEVAQEVADQYMLNVKVKCRKFEKYTKIKCQKMKDEADQYLEQIKLNAEELTESKEKNIEKTTDKNDFRKKKTVKVGTKKSVKRRKVST